MASAYSTPYSYEPYVQQLPLDAIFAGLQYKQQKFDANFERLNNYIQNVANIELAKGEDKEYLYNNLKMLVDNVNRMGTGDLSLTGATEQIAQYIGYAVDDKVINGIAGTKVYNNIIDRYEWFLENDPDRANEANLGFSLRGISEWLNDGEAGSNYKKYPNVSTDYIPYIDMFDEASKILKEKRPDITIQPKPYGGGFYYFEKNEMITEQSVVDMLDSLIFTNPNIAQQMRINSWATVEKQPTEDIARTYDDFLDSRIYSYEQAIKSAKINKKKYKPGSAEYEVYTETIREHGKKLSELKGVINKNDDDYLKYVEENKEDISLQLYKENFVNGMVEVYAYDQLIDTNLGDFELARYKSYLSNKSNTNKQLSDFRLKIAEALAEDPTGSKAEVLALWGDSMGFEGTGYLNTLKNMMLLPTDVSVDTESNLYNTYDFTLGQIEDLAQEQQRSLNKLKYSHDLEIDIDNPEDIVNLQNLLNDDNLNDDLRRSVQELLDVNDMLNEKQTIIEIGRNEIIKDIKRELFEINDAGQILKDNNGQLKTKPGGEYSLGGGSSIKVDKNGDIILDHPSLERSNLKEQLIYIGSEGKIIPGSPEMAETKDALSRRDMGWFGKFADFVTRNIPMLLQGPSDLPIEGSGDELISNILDSYRSVRPEFYKYDMNNILNEELGVILPAKSYNLARTGDMHLIDNVVAAMPTLDDPGISELIPDFAKNAKAFQEEMQDPESKASANLLVSTNGAILVLRDREGNLIKTGRRRKATGEIQLDIQSLPELDNLKEIVQRHMSLGQQEISDDTADMVKFYNLEQQARENQVDYATSGTRSYNPSGKMSLKDGRSVSYTPSLEYIWNRGEKTIEGRITRKEYQGDQLIEEAQEPGYSFPNQFYNTKQVLLFLEKAMQGIQLDLYDVLEDPDNVKQYLIKP